MTIKERMDELVKHGAVLTVWPTGGRGEACTLAGVVWRQRPARFRWCAIFPEHMGHIHETTYDEVKLLNDGRDIAFFEAGDMVAYVAPYEEANLDVGQVHDAFVEWRQRLAQFNNAEQFAEFLETA